MVQYVTISEIVMSILQKPIVLGRAYKEVALRDRIIGDLEGSLVLYLPFEEGIGVKVRDYSLFKNHGDISGASWVDGKYGKALSFDGKNDYVDLGDVIEGCDLTILAWIKLSAAPISDGDICSKELVSCFCVSSTLHLYNITCDGVEWDDVYSWSPDALKLNRWYHVASVATPLTNKIFIDGVLVDEVTPTRTRGQSADPRGIGGSEAGGIWVYFFPGIIDEVRVYNRDLSTQEIKRYFEATRSVYGV